YILNQSKTKVLFIPLNFRKFNHLEMVRALKDELPYLDKVVVIDKYQEETKLNDSTEINYKSCFTRGDFLHEAVEVNDSDPLLLMYTSGTTSDPKGAIHTHATLIHESNTMIDLYRLDQEDNIFMPSPVTHIAGLVNGLEFPFMLGCKVVLQDVWDPKEAVETIIRENCTFTLGATPFLQGIYQYVRETGRKIPLRIFPCGGADVPPELVIQASKYLECFVTRVYGSTEYPTFLLCGPHDPKEKAAYTDGRPLKGSVGKILDEEGKELPIGNMGELAVKGPEMFLGYIQSKFNEDAFTEDGYFLTGDLAVMDEDGYFQIKGRKKDIIIRGGENIPVKEVEELLYQHEKIARVAVVAMPDEKMGEKACAYLELNGDGTIDLEEIKRFLLDRGIAIQKIPERLEIIPEMPMTTSGKVQKYLLREDIKKKVSETLSNNGVQ
ncbi:MAG TPA: AMP-binding protein, partial [Chondromyces sp.]|nr:AMP-binding protein [Chondromyces sp.]